MYQIQKIYNGVDPAPSDIELHTIFEMLKDNEEDGWLKPDANGTAVCELDIEGLLKLLLSNYRVAHREFDFSSELRDMKLIYHNVPEYLCGYYTVVDYYGEKPIHSFEQWSL